MLSNKAFTISFDLSGENRQSLVNEITKNWDLTFLKIRLKFFILFFALSCSPQFSKINYKKPYTGKGLAYIYNDHDFNEKIIKGRMSNDKMQISLQNLRTGILVKIINPKKLNNKKKL